LTKEFGSRNIDFKYIDVSSPEILEYVNDITTIVEGRLPFPFISMNSKPLCWGLMEPSEILNRVKGKITRDQD